VPELATTRLLAPGIDRASRSMLFFHGILGRRLNWRGIARRWVEARPEWCAVLVDLRAHGDSQGFAPPHTLDACVDDLGPVIDGLDAPLGGVLGHSFGGKVALLATARWSRDLLQTWVIDSPPGTRERSGEPDGAIRVLRFLERTTFPIASRAAFLEAADAEGLSPGTAQWLAMNLVRQADGTQTLGIDTTVIRAMLEDYFTRDLWPIVEEPPIDLRLVLGGRSPLFDDEDRARLARIDSSLVHVDVVPDAGHWVHADQPDALVELLIRHVPEGR
jgi:pimeloyl-ACP methyl ester carboxylesterase